MLFKTVPPDRSADRYPRIMQVSSISRGAFTSACSSQDRQTIATDSADIERLSSVRYSFFAFPSRPLSYCYTVSYSGGKIKLLFYTLAQW